MQCRDCFHFLPSEKANHPRPGLIGYGYCAAAPSAVLRARFFHDSTRPCWLALSRYQEMPRAQADS